jgi:ornithine--oxo-acid transaminase
MFGQMLVMRLFRNHSVLTQVCGNNFMVLKAAPPLIVSEAQVFSFVKAVESVVDEVHSSTAFWSDALGLVRRTMNI